uniref:Uncharacterized protein n=1 Tax=Glycine max TaxID=3847 RepID=K7M204_SOYBN
MRRTLLASENSLPNSKAPSEEDMLCNYVKKERSDPFNLWFMKIVKVRELEAIKVVEDAGWFSKVKNGPLYRQMHGTLIKTKWGCFICLLIL